ncbi:MAG: lipase maturation factor family protein [Desulfuromonadaceae bacterium]
MTAGPTSQIALAIFPRLLGVVYLLAFVSLLVQVRGLYGSGGILPLRDVTAALRRNLGAAGCGHFPSIFWFNTSDSFITGAAGMGVFLSILLACGIATPLALILLWLIYLSFTSLGQEFLSYQWDALILETGFMTIFLPLAIPAPSLVCLAYQFFIFRFMLSAGVVKLSSGDPNWRKLRALCFHYETQPLPNRVAWYAHQLPEWLQKLSVLGSFFFELLVPFCCLGPAPFKLAGFCLLVFFQVLLMLTGSYGFFNILTIVLCVPLLDDRYVGVVDRAVTLPAPVVATGGSPFMTALASTIFMMFLALNVLQLIRLFYRTPLVSRILAFLQPWYVSSPYGLFAVMTVDRFEFVIEGSNDLKSWQAYEFRWKPGDPAVPPRQAAPHQPRLDWQMWFAALNPNFVEPWLKNLLLRLLEGSPPVVALFRTVPFRDAPPAFIRLKVYRYHFTDWATRRAGGGWWRRNKIGGSAPMALKGGGKVTVPRR